MRDWKKLSHDEIIAIWESYCHNEFPGYSDPLGLQRPWTKSVRITPMEMIRLVEELIERLAKREENGM